jgi:hypothetical protein
MQVFNFGIQDNIDEMKQAQAEMKAEQRAFEAEVRNQFERMTEMLNQLLQGRYVNNNVAQALDPPAKFQSTAKTLLFLVVGMPQEAYRIQPRKST